MQEALYVIRTFWLKSTIFILHLKYKTMCADRECSISNTTPCVFVFRRANSSSAQNIGSRWVWTQIINVDIFLKRTLFLSSTPVEPKADANKMDTDWMMSVSAKKQRNLTEFCLRKQVMIQNTMTEMKNTRDGNNPTWSAWRSGWLLFTLF